MKIDFVVTWVDSKDRNWQDSYSKTFPNEKANFNRFTDMGLLKYWFRMVEEHTPWVNKIHFITFGHIPDFLDIENPKINVVNHEDYIPKKYLPTFSSHPIENNLHRIEELSEHFVYFNDDMYITKNLKQDYFFKNGKPCLPAILRPNVASYYDHISSVQHNNYSIINQNFRIKEQIRKNRFKWFNYKYGLYNLSNLLFSTFNNLVGFYETHVYSPLLKSTLVEIWEKEFEIMDLTSSHKKRNIKTDVNQWLFKYWQIVSGEFMPKKLNDSKLIMLTKIEDIQLVSKALEDNKNSIVCVNDHVENEEDYGRINEGLKLLFDKKYPEKSSFEK